MITPKPATKPSTPVRAVTPPKQPGPPLKVAARSPEKPSPTPAAPPPRPLGPADMVSMILLRDAYRYERGHLIDRALWAMLVLLFVSLVGNGLLLTRPVFPHYIPVDSERRVRQLAPLDEELPIADVNTWVTNAVVQAYTFSFANYRAELGQAQENFTPSGWEGFEKALKASGIINSVVESKYVTTAVPKGAPELVEKGLASPKGVAGRVFAWRFTMPLELTLQSSKDMTSRELQVTILVVRRPQTENRYGLGIVAIQAE